MSNDKKVLIIDDVNFFIELEKSYLENVDCEIFTAKNGKDGLEIAVKEKPNLIFLDYEMPIMDGMVFLQESEKYPELSQTSIVVVSAFLDNTMERKLIEAGAFGILKKPFTQEAFIRIVADVLKLNRRNKERINTELPAFFGFEDKMEKGLIVDISESGAFLSSNELLKINTFFELKFFLSNEQKTIKTWARVIWINLPDKKTKETYPVGRGIEFVNLSKEYQKDIQNLIRTLKSGY